MITFKDEELELLPNQGHCNLNYLLVQGEKKYHVRKFRLADRDRKLEFKIQKLAHKKGIAAKPMHLDDSMMIGDFIEGVHKNRLRKKEIRKLANVIKKLHRINFRQKPILFSKAKKFKKELVLCHGDLNVKNILFGKIVKLIDWEYAGIYDRYFDLASVCKEFKFSKADEECFLRAYVVKIDSKKLEVYKEIYEILHKEWLDKLKKGKLEFL